MIAGDHDGDDSRRPAGRDRLLYFGSRRVDEAGEPDELEVALHDFRRSQRRRQRRPAAGRRNPERAAPPPPSVSRAVQSGGPSSGTSPGLAAPGHRPMMTSAAPFVIDRKCRRPAGAPSSCTCDRSRRAARRPAAPRPSSIAIGHPPARRRASPLQWDRPSLVPAAPAASWLIAIACSSIRRRACPGRSSAAITIVLLDPHLVCRECASLVGADERDRTQGLDGRQAPDQCPVRGHLARADGQRNTDDRG